MGHPLVAAAHPGQASWERSAHDELERGNPQGRVRELARFRPRKPGFTRPWRAPGRVGLPTTEPAWAGTAPSTRAGRPHQAISATHVSLRSVKTLLASFLPHTSQ